MDFASKEEQDRLRAGVGAGVGALGGHGLSAFSPPRPLHIHDHDHGHDHQQIATLQQSVKDLRLIVTDLHFIVKQQRVDLNATKDRLAKAVLGANARAEGQARATSPRARKNGFLSSSICIHQIETRLRDHETRIKLCESRDAPPSPSPSPTARIDPVAEAAARTNATIASKQADALEDISRALSKNLRDAARSSRDNAKSSNSNINSNTQENSLIYDPRANAVAAAAAAAATNESQQYLTKGFDTLDVLARQQPQRDEPNHGRGRQLEFETRQRDAFETRLRPTTSDNNEVVSERGCGTHGTGPWPNVENNHGDGHSPQQASAIDAKTPQIRRDRGTIPPSNTGPIAPPPPASSDDNSRDGYREGFAIDEIRQEISETQTTLSGITESSDDESSDDESSDDESSDSLIQTATEHPFPRKRSATRKYFRTKPKTYAPRKEHKDIFLWHNRRPHRDYSVPRRIIRAANNNRPSATPSSTKTKSNQLFENVFCSGGNLDSLPDLLRSKIEPLGFSRAERRRHQKLIPPCVDDGLPFEPIDHRVTHKDKKRATKSFKNPISILKTLIPEEVLPTILRT